MKGSYAIVSILAYFHPLQISLSILGIVHFLSGGGGQVGFDGRGGGGMKNMVLRRESVRRKI